MEDNEKAITDAIKQANLPQFPDFTEINQTLKAAAKANIQHTYHQQGPHLICHSCPYQHSQWIGMDKKLKGYDEGGKPIIE